MKVDQGWVGGNRLRLLENGEEFFPAVFAAIEAAQREVLLETFILFEDKVGLALHAVLLAAAKRGVRIEMTIDGFGSPTLSSDFVHTLTDAGVRVHVFDPPPRFSRRLRPFRRLHRKIVVVDGEVGFIGGINYSADHLSDFGPEAKQDYAVEVKGPIVAHLRREAQRIIEPKGHLWRARQPTQSQGDAVEPAQAGQAHVKVITRDNNHHRDDIERHYRMALHSAKDEVLIANAYFFPGYRLLRALQRAARRGVKVHLILQGQSDVPMATYAARMIYQRLLHAGVNIYEYCERPIHAKVAVIDDEWATIGSSNLDPLSLSLNLEANLAIRDREFNSQLRQNLRTLMTKSCTRIEANVDHPWRWWSWLGYPAFHVLRHFPRWAMLLPAHKPELRPAAESNVVVQALSTQKVQPWAWQSSPSTDERRMA